MGVNRGEAETGPGGGGRGTGGSTYRIQVPTRPTARQAAETGGGGGGEGQGLRLGVTQNLSGRRIQPCEEPEVLVEKQVQDK